MLTLLPQLYTIYLFTTRLLYNTLTVHNGIWFEGTIYGSQTNNLLGPYFVLFPFQNIINLKVTVSLVYCWSPPNKILFI